MKPLIVFQKTIKLLIVLNIVVLIVVLLSCAGFALAGQTQQSKPGTVSTKSEAISQIKKMVKEKIPDAAIVAQIKKLGSSLVATPDDLVALKDLGASDSILVAVSGAGETESKSADNPPVSPPLPEPKTDSNSSWKSDLTSLNCQAPASTSKRVIAVDEIQLGAVQTNTDALFGANINVGKGIQAAFIKRLVENGRFTVVERGQVDTIMKEQDISQSNRGKPGTGGRVGRLTGADVYLMGDVTVFGHDVKKSGIGGILGPIVKGYFGLANFKWGKDKFVLVVSYRLVDVETGIAIETGTVRGESARGSKGVDIGGIFGGTIAGAGYNEEQQARQVIVGEAALNCADDLATQLDAKAEKIPQRNLDITALVAQVSGTEVYLNKGTNDGVNKCDRFKVSRIVREILDPETKEPIDRELQEVGNLIVIEVRDKISIGLYDGSQAPKVRFLAQKVLPEKQ